jgi:hypothetical protein
MPSAARNPSPAQISSADPKAFLPQSSAINRRMPSARRSSSRARSLFPPADNRMTHGTPGSSNSRYPPAAHRVRHSTDSSTCRTCIFLPPARKRYTGIVGPWANSTAHSLRAQLPSASSRQRSVTRQRPRPVAPRYPPCVRGRQRRLSPRCPPMRPRPQFPRPQLPAPPPRCLPALPRANF